MDLEREAEASFSGYTLLDEVGFHAALRALKTGHVTRRVMEALNRYMDGMRSRVLYFPPADRTRETLLELAVSRSMEVLKTVEEVIDDRLTSRTQPTARAVSRLLRVTEKAGFMIAGTIPPGEVRRYGGQKELMHVQISSVSLARPNMDALTLRHDSALVTFPAVSVRPHVTNSTDDHLILVFSWYKAEVFSAMLPVRISHAQTPVQSASDFNETSNNQTTAEFPAKKDGLLINSDIVSVFAQMGGKRVTSLTMPLLLQLQHMTTVPQYGAKCVYLTPEVTWSERGCQVVRTNDTHTTCHCLHLTSFAVLMNFQSITGSGAGEKHAGETDLHERVLTYLTYIGGSLSISCLILSLLTFVSLRSVRGDRNTVHIHLALTLCLAQLLFLLGVERTDNKVECALIAGLLHYLWLSAFAWMLVEGLHVYLKLVLVLHPPFTLQPVYLLIGYGIPAVLVTLSAAIFSQGYGTDEYCWLSEERGFIWSFQAPALLVVAFNTVMFGIAIKVMCQHFHSSGKRDLATVVKLKTWLRGSVALVTVLGCTWVFGALHMGGEETVAFAFLFVICTSLQGVFVFIFHCLLNDKVRRAYQQKVRRAVWMPVCLRSVLFRLTTSKDDYSTSFGLSTGMTTVDSVAGHSHTTSHTPTTTTTDIPTPSLKSDSTPKTMPKPILKLSPRQTTTPTKLKGTATHTSTATPISSAISVVPTTSRVCECEDGSDPESDPYGGVYIGQCRNTGRVVSKQAKDTGSAVSEQKGNIGSLLSKRKVNIDSVVNEQERNIGSVVSEEEYCRCNE